MTPEGLCTNFAAQLCNSFAQTERPVNCMPSCRNCVALSTSNVPVRKLPSRCFKTAANLQRYVLGFQEQSCAWHCSRSFYDFLSQYCPDRQSNWRQKCLSKESSPKDDSFSIDGCPLEADIPSFGLNYSKRSNRQRNQEAESSGADAVPQGAKFEVPQTCKIMMPLSHQSVMLTVCSVQSYSNTGPCSEDQNQAFSRDRAVQSMFMVRPPSWLPVRTAFMVLSGFAASLQPRFGNEPCCDVV